MLGTNRLDAPIQKHKPDLVLHGHVHAGTFAGAVGGVPVYNVAVHVTSRAFFCLRARQRCRTGRAPRGPGPVSLIRKRAQG
jgi:Icc-related predicted phosphoesterase